LVYFAASKPPFLKLCVFVYATSIGKARHEKGARILESYTVTFLPILSQNGTRKLRETKNTFCRTWYLPHSWVHYDRHCHLVFMSQLLAYLQHTRLLFTLVKWQIGIFAAKDSKIKVRPILHILIGMREPAIFLLPVWNMTSLSCPLTPISCMRREFRRFAKNWHI